MILIHQILNIACLLLWLNWRSIGFVTPSASATFSLASTLKETEPQFAARWIYLVTLLALLLIRSLFYWHTGSAINWTPALNLVAITLPFRSDHFPLMVLFSGLSFALLLGGFYAWLLLLSAINAKVPDAEAIQKLIRLHLGWLERCPALLKIVLPVLAAALVWIAVSPSLVQLGILPPTASTKHLMQQAALLGCATLLAWKFLLLGIFILHLLNSYVYLGNASYWTFVNLTARNFLRPMAWLPLRIGKADFTPVVAIVLVFALAALGNIWFPEIYRRLPL